MWAEMVIVRDRLEKMRYFTLKLGKVPQKAKDLLNLEPLACESMDKVG